MDTQPVYSIGSVLTSFKLAIVAIATVIVVFLPEDMQATAGTLIIAAVSAATIFIGDLVGYILTREKVTPISNPTLQPGTVINADSPSLPTITVPSAIQP